MSDNPFFNSTLQDSVLSLRDSPGSDSLSLESPEIGVSHPSPWDPCDWYVYLHLIHFFVDVGKYTIHGPHGF